MIIISVNLCEKMTNFIPNKEFLHRILLYYFHKKERATISWCITNNLKRIYGKKALNERKCKEWFGYFERGKYVFVSDDEKSSSSEEVVEAERMEEDALLEQTETSRELDDLEETKIIAEFIKHSDEIKNTSGMNSNKLSKKNTFIRQILLHYYNVKRDTSNTAKSDRF